MPALTITLQPEEARAIERAIMAVLRHEESTRIIYPHGAEKRAAKRVLKKLHWAESKGLPHEAT